MNKDKVKGYISDIQIAMGKILEEIDNDTITAKEMTNDEKGEAYRKEMSMIDDVLSKSASNTIVEVTEEELMLQVKRECGIT